MGGMEAWQPGAEAQECLIGHSVEGGGLAGHSETWQRCILCGITSPFPTSRMAAWEGGGQACVCALPVLCCLLVWDISHMGLVISVWVRLGGASLWHVASVRLRASWIAECWLILGVWDGRVKLRGRWRDNLLSVIPASLTWECPQGCYLLRGLYVSGGNTCGTIKASISEGCGNI